MGERYGLRLFGAGQLNLDCSLWLDDGMRPFATISGVPMNGWNILAAVLAGGVFVYLVAVLLRPEDFS